MLTAVLVMLVLTVPGYVLMVRFPGILVIYGVMAALSILNGFFSGPALMALTETLPKAVRSVTLGTLYAVAMATFGGSTQVIVKWLIDVTGSALAPAWYLTGALAVGATAMAMVRETAPVKTGRI
jgi:hypothetical protein